MIEPSRHHKLDHMKCPETPSVSFGVIGSAKVMLLIQTAFKLIISRKIVKQRKYGQCPANSVAGTIAYLIW
jgi:hypothetical protein